MRIIDVRLESLRRRSQTTTPLTILVTGSTTKDNSNSFPEADGILQSETFGRFVSGLMHPLIRVGYGLGFSLLGIPAEDTTF